MDVPDVDEGVEFREGVDLGDGDEVVTAEPADLPLDAALLMRPLDARLTVEGLDAVVGSERGPSVGLDPLAGEADHARDGGLEVVVADLPGRDPAEHIEGVCVALEEGFLPSRGADSVHSLAGVGEPQTEQRACDQLAAQPDRDLAEVDLGLPTGEVFLRDEGVRGFSTGLDADLAAAGGDVVADHPVRDDACGLVLVQQPVEDPLGGMPLLPRRVEIVAQPAVDHVSVRIEP